MTKTLQYLPASPTVRASIENVLARQEKSGNFWYQYYRMRSIEVQ